MSERPVPYRRRPTGVLAMPVTAENAEDVARWCKGRAIRSPAGDITHVLVETHHGMAAAMLGDWVIQGLEGEFYPCKNSVFIMTYE
jgi:hypothetical protein